MKTSRTIGIIAWGAQADVLYATPIVRHIRRLHPDDHITWIVRDKFADVVRTNPDIDAVEEWGLLQSFATRQDAEYKMDCDIREFAARMYDKVYDLQYWPKYTNFYENPMEDFISLRARNAGLDPKSIVDRSVVLGISEEDEKAALRFMLDNDLGPIDSMGIYPRFITVNHISYASSPVWSLDHYQALVDSLAQQDIKSIFTGAPGEPLPDRVIDARGMPYMQWAALIGESDAWLGLDSGAKSLAAATQTPMVILHSRDFPLAKTGIKAMGLRQENVMELCPAPNVDTVMNLLVGMME